MYCKYGKVLLVIEKDRREVLLDLNKERDGLFQIKYDSENSLNLFSIGIYDIKDGRVSIVLESTKGIKDIGLLSEEEMFVVFSERKVVKYYIESSTINY